MLETILTMITGAVIAIVSGWITSLREHKFRLIEEDSRRDFEMARNAQDKRYEIVLSKSERAERILDELEDGFYALMTAQERICRDAKLSDDERKKLLVPFDSTSKNYSKMLVFDDDLIKKHLADLVQIYVEEFTFTDTLNNTEQNELPDVVQNMVRGSLRLKQVTELSGKIRKMIDDIKISVWSSAEV
ncbi:MAG: hypothetical protein ABIJ39_02545 [Chloroflexota bacterium]